MTSEIASPAEGARNLLFNFPELFNVAPPREHLFQLHWQNRNDFKQTQFVAQFGGRSFEEIEAALNDVTVRHNRQCPDGWVPLVCNEDSEYFVLAAVPQVVEGK